MKIHRILIPFLMLFVSGCISSKGPEQKILIGHFSYINRDIPGCGTIAFATKSTFIVDGSNRNEAVAVPCVEMQYVEGAKLGKHLLREDERYRIVLSKKPLTPDMQSPFFDRHPWYLVEATK